MWLKGFRSFNSFYPIESHPHFMARQSHQDRKRFCSIQIVINNEHSTAHSRRGNGWIGQGLGLRSLN